MKNKPNIKDQPTKELEELRQRVAELEAGEAWHSLAELAPDSIVTVDLKGVVTWCNAKTADMSGRSKDEIVGQHFSKLPFLAAADMPTYRKLFDSIRRREAPKTFEASWQDGDGATRWSEVHLGVIKRGDAPTGILGIARDITARKRREEETKRRNAQLAALYAVTRTAAQTLDLDVIMNSVLDEVLNVLELDAGIIALLDSETGQISLAEYRGLSEDFVENARRHAAGKDLDDLLPFGRQHVQLEDLSQDPRAELLRDDFQREELHSGISVPLESKGAAVGMLGVISREPRQFTPQDVELLASIGSQIAVGVENARLYQDQTRRLSEVEALCQTALDMSSQLDVPQLLRSIVERAAALVGTKAGGLYLYHPQEEELEMVVNSYQDVDYTGTRLKVGEGLSGKVVETGEPLIVEDYRTWEGRSDKYNGAPFRAVMGVPLRWGESILGVINVTDVEQPRIFTERDIQLLELIASQAAVALENARLYEAQQGRSQELMALHETSLHIISPLDLDTLLEEIITRAVDLLDARSGDLYLYRLDCGDLVSAASKGIPPELEGAVMKAGEGVAGRILEAREPLVVDDYDAWEGRSDSYAGYGFARVVGVPIQYGEELLGLVVVERPLEGPPFGQKDVNLLILFANQAAIAIENARLYGRAQARTAHLETLQQITATLLRSTLPLSEVLETIAEGAARALDYVGSLIVVPDERRERLVLGGVWGSRFVNAALNLTGQQMGDFSLSLENDENPIAQAFLGSELQTLTGVPDPIVAGVEPAISPKLARAIRRAMQARLAACVPLSVADKAVGVLTVFSTREQLSDDERAMLLNLANQAGLAIENARLYEETQHKADELAVLYDVSLDLAGELELPTLLKTIVERAIDLVAGDSGGLYLYEPRRQDLEMVAHHGIHRDFTGTRLTLGEGLCGKVAQTGQPLAVTDYANWQGKSPQFDDGLPYSALGVPIKRGDTLLGTLYVADPHTERTFDERDIRLTTLFANQAAIAIENARLFEETTKTVQELSILHEASSSAASTLRLAEITERIVEALHRTLRFSHLTIMLRDEESQTLKILAGTGYDPDVAERIELKVGKGITGWVALAGEPVNVPDVSADERYIPADENVRSELCVPLEVGDKIIGVINIESTQRAAFSDDDLQFMSTLAGQLAVIIENARLYEQWAESEERHRTLFEDSRDAVYITTREGRLLEANQALLDLFGFSREEITAMQADELYADPADRLRFQEEIERRGALRDYELKLRKKDGREMDCLITATLWRDKDGDVLGYQGIIRDITERKRAQQALEESEEIFRSLAEQSPNMIFINQKGKVLYANQKCEEIMGYTREEFYSPDFDYLSLIAPESKDFVMGTYAKHITGEDVPPYEYTLVTKGGKRVDGILATRVITYGGQPAILGTGTDITQRKRAEEELQQSFQRLQTTLESTVSALAALGETRDPYTAGHQERVANLAAAIAEEMGLPEEHIRGVHLAGLVHDIGKIHVPAEILSKPTRLTELEMMMIRTHPQAAYDVLRGIEFPWPVAEIVLQHHERMDGSGYPQGLPGEEILIEARILGVADVVEAMASHRPYRAAHAIGEAFEEISRNKGKLYDADVVEACLKVIMERGFKLG